MKFCFNRLAGNPLRRNKNLLLCGIAAVSGLVLAGCSSPVDHAGTAPARGTATVSEALPDVATPARLRIMTQEQYANTIRYLFGQDIDVGAPFAPLQRTSGLLATGAASAGVTSGQLQQIQRVAASVSAQVMDAGKVLVSSNFKRRLPGHRDVLVPCTPADSTAADDACAAKFVTSKGRYLFRQPLSEAKVASLVAEAHKDAESLHDFYAGLTTVLESMLLDPEVVMITDVPEPDPKRPGHFRLNAYSLASRLSFFLWDAGPDDALLKAAQSGALYTKDGRAKIVDMMLASPRLEVGVRAFFDDMFGFDDFANLAKDATVYPYVNGQTLIDAREQTLRTVVDHLIVKKRDYRDLFTTKDTFISPELAAIYGAPTQPGWALYEFPQASPRFGILTQVSFLALHSHPARSSATERGKALRELLLCQQVPAPPPNVDFSIVEDPKANFHTARERLTAHRKNPVCAGCHKITDPIGLALENFDGAGQYRATERGTPIDASGSLDSHDFKDVVGLTQALHDHPSLPTCLVRRVYSYGIGGSLSTADEPVVDYLSKSFAAHGYRLPDLLRTIATSDVFAEVTETPPPNSKSADASGSIGVASK